MVPGFLMLPKASVPGLTVRGQLQEQVSEEKDRRRRAKQRLRPALRCLGMPAWDPRDWE